MGLTVCPDEPTWRDFGNHLASTTGREQLTAAAHGVGQLLRDGDVVLFLDATADGNQNGVLGDIHIAGLGDDRLQIAPSRGQSADLGRLVDDYALEREHLPTGLNAPGTNVDDRAR